jgi:pimeloyl-ACP methyl ester carboxylesterase
MSIPSRHFLPFSLLESFLLPAPGSWLLPLRPHPRSACFVPLLAALLLACPSFGAEQASPADSAPRVPRFEILFSPFTTDRAALSPDGKLLAYTLREKDLVSVVVIEVDNPSVVKAKVNAVDSKIATAMLDPNNRENTLGEVRWMRWVNNTRLVLETNMQAALYGDNGFVNTSEGGAIIGFDADGKNARVLATARDTSSRDVQVINNDEEKEREDPATARRLATPDELKIPEPDVTIKSTLSASAPHIVGLIPGDPDHVLVRTDPVLLKIQALAYDVLKLDVNDGKLTRLGEQMMETRESTLMDRQGRARVSVPISFRNKFPHTMRIAPTSLFGKMKKLDDIAGTKGAFVVSPENYFGRRNVPLCFDQSGGILYMASNLERNTYGVYGLDLKTGKRTGIAFENPDFDLYEPQPGAFPNYRRNVGDEYGKVEFFSYVDFVPPEKDTLVFDRFEQKIVGIRFEALRKTAAWLLPELHAAQIELEALMPSSSVEIQEWNASRTRFLVFCEGPANPGIYYLYDRGAKRLFEFVRCEPLLNASNMNASAEFSFKHPNGDSVTGLLTLPRYVRTHPAPLVIMCGPHPWERVHLRYSAEAQALANMGFAVAQISSRAAWGTGLKARTSAAQGAEKAFAEDMLLVADQLCQRFKFNRQRVGLYGDGMGAFCTLWALQLHPEAFRCAVVVNTIVDPAVAAEDAYNANGSVQLALEQSFFGGSQHMKTIGLSANHDAIARPVCFLHYRGPEGELRRLSYIDAHSVFSDVKRRSPESEFFDLDLDYMQGLPLTRSAAFRNITGFFNLNLYDYKTDTGATKVLPDEIKK